MIHDNADRRLTIIQLWPTLCALVILTASGCASSGTTLARPGQGDGQVIYRLSDEQACTIAPEA